MAGTRDTCVWHVARECGGGVTLVCTCVLTAELMLLTSRAPQEMPPTWNVVLLMTPLSWLCTLATMMAVVVFLDITSLMVKRGMGLSVTTREIVLYPFRYTVLQQDA